MHCWIPFGTLSLGIFSSIGDDDVTYSFKVKKINSTNEDKHFELDLLPDVLDYFKLNRHIMCKLFETIDEVFQPTRSSTLSLT